MLQISEKEIKKRLLFDNPWWENEEQIDERFNKMPRRSYFELFFDLITDKSVNRALILMGPRRVGKTVMVYHAIQRLINEGLKPTQILYLSIETPVYTGLSLEQLVNFFQELHNHQRKDALVIFFDEIQYLKNWEIHLKSLVDSYPDYKFIATGSAAAALRLKSIESGAGRFSNFILPPLTFAEYLRFIEREDELILTFFQGQSNKEIDAIRNIYELNQEFINYLNYGGYPEAVFSKTIQLDSSQYIKSDIIDKVLLRDLPSLYGINDIQELNRLFTTLAYNTGNEVSLESLSKSAGVAKNTLKRYLEYLEAAFLIKCINRIDRNAKHFQRATSFKVYLTNPSMRAALFGFVTEEDEAMGALTETALFSQWFHSEKIEQIYYARWKTGEVDLVYLRPDTQKPEWCVEVKWSDRIVNNLNELSGLVQFIQENGLVQTSVTTKTITDLSSINGIMIRFQPIAEMIYLLGKNIINNKIKPS
ncbi:MAG: ATP-binding protein [Snowella sp.]|nr:ATP-binding protein [Snowella sp.]